METFNLVRTGATPCTARCGRWCFNTRALETLLDLVTVDLLRQGSRPDPD
jgi:hypothetical protein